MAIQNRRGNEADFIAGRMLPAEFAVSVDQNILRICFASGTVKQVALTDDVTQAISNYGTTIDARLVPLEAASQTMGTSLQAVIVRVGNAEEAIRDHAGRILVLETDNTNTKARLSDAEDLIQQIQESVDTLNLNMITVGNDVDNLKDNAVRFDAAQNKTSAQKLQARKNTDSADVLSLAPQYTVKAYAVGDMTTSNGKMYRCKAPIATGEQWTASHWEEVTVGSEISSLKEDLDEVFSDNAKAALLNCFQHVAWIDEQGQDCYDALEELLNPATDKIVSITAQYTQGSNIVSKTDLLDDLKPFLDVTATYSNGKTEIVEDYTLSGTLNNAQSFITASYKGKTSTFSVVVSLVPSGYTEKNYILSNGTQYIRTDISETDAENWWLRYKIMPTEYFHKSGHLFSSNNFFSPFLAYFEDASPSIKQQLNAVRYGTSGAVATYPWDLNTEYTFEAYKNSDEIYVNGEYASQAATGSTKSQNNKFTILTYGGQPTNAQWRFRGRMYYFKAIDVTTGIKVHDFVPCLNASNVAGLYDLVDEVFYAPSSGTLDVD